MAAKAETVKLLIERIQHRLEKDPFEFEGLTWARDLYGWAPHELKVSTKTVQRWAVPRNGIVIRRTKRMTLARLGSEDPVTPYRQAQKMAGAFNAYLKQCRSHPKHGNRRAQRTTLAEFKMLLVLADKRWPTEHAPEIFRMVLKNWGSFKSGVKVRYYEQAAEQGIDIERYDHQFHHFPCLAMMCRYADVALDMWAFPQAYELNVSS